jgi:hypothetical protein
MVETAGGGLEFLAFFVGDRLFVRLVVGAHEADDALAEGALGILVVVVRHGPSVVFGTSRRMWRRARRRGTERVSFSGFGGEAVAARDAGEQIRWIQVPLPKHPNLHVGMASKDG